MWKTCMCCYHITSLPRRPLHNALQPTRTDDGVHHLAHLPDQLVARQLAALWLCGRDHPPLHELDRALCLKLSAHHLPERRLPPRFDLMALFPAVRRRLLASDRPNLPRSVRRCLQLHARHAEAHAQKLALLPRSGRFILLAFFSHRYGTRWACHSSRDYD